MAGAGPRKEIDGLVFDLDFASNKTFAGLGATASSLISSRSASLKYGVTYEGQYGGNINFDNDNDFMLISNSADVQISNGTLYSWVKTSINEPFFKSVLTKNNAYGLYIRNGIPVCIDWNTNTEYSSNFNIADGKWHHLVLAFQSGVVNGSSLYIDGDLKLTYSMTVRNQLSDIYIGSNEILPGFVKKGLIFSIDAHNGKSYPGTGSTWFDLSGYDRHLSLYNSPTFDSSSGGALSFNGTNQYAETANWGLLTGATNFTVLTTFKIVNTQNQTWISFGTGSTSTSNQVGISTTAVGGLYSNNTLLYETSNFLSNTWNTMGLTYNGTTLKMYINGNIAKRKNTSLNVGSSNLRIARSIVNANEYANVTLANLKIYNRALSDTEMSQNYDIIKNIYANTASGERTLGTLADPAPSGFALKNNYPDLPSGYYYIKSLNMPSPLLMYVDMTNDGGGYDYYTITNGSSVSLITEVHSGTALGLDLVYPRSIDHWKSMYEFVTNVLGSNTATYLQTCGAIYRNGGIGNYTSYVMRDPNSYAGGAPDWQVPDGGRWWLRDSVYGEPNGNYTNNGFLRLYQVTSTGYINNFDDLGAAATSTTYLVSTNAKP